MSLSGKDVAEIARLLDASRFSELELEVGDFKLRIRRDGAGPAPRRVSEPRPVATAKPPAPDTPAPAAQIARANEVDVPAPLLGTLRYRPRLVPLDGTTPRPARPGRLVCPAGVDL